MKKGVKRSRKLKDRQDKRTNNDLQKKNTKQKTNDWIIWTPLKTRCDKIREKHHIVGTFSKPNRKIVERGKIDISNTQIHDDTPNTQIHDDTPNKQIHDDTPNTQIHDDTPNTQIHDDHVFVC